MRNRALLLLLLALVVTGVSRRVRARKKVAQRPVACMQVVGVSNPLGTRLACASDPALSHCGDLLLPGRVYRESDCQSQGLVAGQILLPRGIPLQLNQASASDLEALPGIGPGLAERIVAERDVADFSSVDELVRVRGIGTRRLETVAELLTVEGSLR